MKNLKTKATTKLYFWVPEYLRDGYMLTKEQKEVALASYETLVRSQAKDLPVKAAARLGDPLVRKPRDRAHRFPASKQPDQTDAQPNQCISRKRKAVDLEDDE